MKSLQKKCSKMNVDGIGKIVWILVQLKRNLQKMFTFSLFYLIDF